MTIQSRINKVTYIYSSSVSRYDIPFKVLSGTAFTVYYFPENEETPLEIGDDYDVHLFPSGKGYITITEAGAEKIEDGSNLEIHRTSVIEQPYSFLSDTAYDKKKVEDALDNITLCLQDLANSIEINDRGLKSGLFSEFNHTISNISAGGLLMSDGDVIKCRRDISFLDTLTGYSFSPSVGLISSGPIYFKSGQYKDTKIIGNSDIVVATSETTQTLSIANNTLFFGSEAMRIPVGATAQRPSSLNPGMFRFDTTLNAFQYYNGTSWVTPLTNPSNPISFSGVLKMPSGAKLNWSASDSAGQVRVNTEHSTFNLVESRGSSTYHLSNTPKLIHSSLITVTNQNVGTFTIYEINSSTVPRDKPKILKIKFGFFSSSFPAYFSVFVRDWNGSSGPSVHYSLFSTLLGRSSSTPELTMIIPPGEYADSLFGTILSFNSSKAQTSYSWAAAVELWCLGDVYGELG